LSDTCDPQRGSLKNDDLLFAGCDHGLTTGGQVIQPSGSASQTREQELIPGAETSPADKKTTGWLFGKVLLTNQSKCQTFKKEVTP
jgi:hypothetical protein